MLTVFVMQNLALDAHKLNDSNVTFFAAPARITAQMNRTGALSGSIKTSRRISASARADHAPVCA